MDRIHINLYDLLTSLSNAQGLVSMKIASHHQQVAYLAYRLAEYLDLPSNEQYDIFLASLIHDIGALSIKERFEIIESAPIHINEHAFRGAKLLEGFEPLKNAAKIIKFHHIPWDHGKGTKYMDEDVPLASHIVNLADRLSTMITYETNILTQVPHIIDKVQSLSGLAFKPEYVDALVSLSKEEYMWLDLVSQTPANFISHNVKFDILKLDIDELIDLSYIFSRIIDFRSRFTSVHSAGVATTAEKLARLMNFSPHECKMMLIAGYLHDLGKIAISDEVLEKPIKLTEYEFNEMRAHTYYTYRLLEPIEDLKVINAWASFHHEKLNGTGYPFKLSGDSLTLGSRIMAVADIFTAITEHRPYRKGMEPEAAKQVLQDMVANNSIDGKVVEILINNYDEINELREDAQQKAAIEYKKFLNV
jgi:HD-GYP domain-containing protein (c-di-GMP phosphodiesterase class II)